MHNKIIQQIENELITSTIKKGRPFGQFVLGTIHEAVPQVRTVVLRNVLPGLKLVFYTDLRSQKVTQLQVNPNVAALFYDPQEKVQLRLEGQAELLEDPHLNSQTWQSVPEKGRKDYCTSQAPGAVIGDQDVPQYLSDGHHLGIVQINTDRLEYLKLGYPHHTRTAYLRKDDQWIATSLIP